MEAHDNGMFATAVVCGIAVVIIAMTVFLGTKPSPARRHALVVAVVAALLTAAVAIIGFTVGPDAVPHV